MFGKNLLRSTSKISLNPISWIFNLVFGGLAAILSVGWTVSFGILGKVVWLANAISFGLVKFFVRGIFKVVRAIFL